MDLPQPLGEMGFSFVSRVLALVSHLRQILGKNTFCHFQFFILFLELFFHALRLSPVLLFQHTFLVRLVVLPISSHFIIYFFSFSYMCLSSQSLSRTRSLFQPLFACETRLRYSRDLALRSFKFHPHPGSFVSSLGIPPRCTSPASTSARSSRLAPRASSTPRRTRRPRRGPSLRGHWLLVHRPKTMYW